MFFGRIDSLASFPAKVLHTMCSSRLRRHAAWASLLTCVLASGFAHADEPSTARPAERGVEPRVPAPPTRAIHVHDAPIESLPAIQSSRGEQRHQPDAFPCAGFYPEHPAHTITLANPQTLRIGAKAYNAVDMTMSVRLDDGTWLCNDDAHENTRDPEILETIPAGEHAIYFGTFERFRALDYQPSIAHDKTPNWAQCDDVEVISAPEDTSEDTSIVTEHTVSHDVYKCSWMLGVENCDWLLPSTASACVDVTSATELTLHTENATFDTTMVVQRVKHTDDGPVADDLALKNDDIGPKNAHSKITATFAPGRYLVFVGSYHRQRDGHFELHIGNASPETP